MFKKLWEKLLGISNEAEVAVKDAAVKVTEKAAKNVKKATTKVADKAVKNTTKAADKAVKNVKKKVTK